MDLARNKISLTDPELPWNVSIRLKNPVTRTTIIDSDGVRCSGYPKGLFGTDLETTTPLAM